MASRKKQSEGIALLSMYNDEDDEEMEDVEDDGQQQELERELQQRQRVESEVGGANNMDEDLRAEADGNTPPFQLHSSTPTQQPQVSVSSPSQLQGGVSSGAKRSGRGRPAIVDYGHDEVAMSPEPEDGEAGTGAYSVDGTEGEIANGNLQGRTSLGASQRTPQTSDMEPSQLDTMNHGASEADVEVDGTADVSIENVDPLDKFLPPPPNEKCPEELQRRIDKFLNLKRAGKSFNAEVRNRKDYRNPDFLLHAVRYQDIDQIGSCFSKDVFDPHGYDSSDFYDEIEADMKRERERKEQENKKNQKVEFVAGGIQPGAVVAASKVSLQLAGVSALTTSSLPSGPTAADNIARDGRQNKKSKWDKVDSDRNFPLPAGSQDSLSTVGAHTVLLSAANAGAGYTAFAQQRRREMEEKRSSERRMEKRS